MAIHTGNGTAAGAESELPRFTRFGMLQAPKDRFADDEMLPQTAHQIVMDEGMLAGLARKRRWQQARRKAGKSTDRPNLVMGANVQVVWGKFANYWEVFSSNICG